jgi:hypothetical protein
MPGLIVDPVSNLHVPTTPHDPVISRGGMVPQIHSSQQPKAADYNPKLQRVRLFIWKYQNIVVTQQTLLIHSSVCVTTYTLGMLCAMTRLKSRILTTFLWKCAGNSILILPGNIDIQPPTRRTVSYEFLSQLVAEYLLASSPDVDVSAALLVNALSSESVQGSCIMPQQLTL